MARATLLEGRGACTRGTQESRVIAAAPGTYYTLSRDEKDIPAFKTSLENAKHEPLIFLAIRRA